MWLMGCLFSIINIQSSIVFIIKLILHWTMHSCSGRIHTAMDFSFLIKKHCLCWFFVLVMFWLYVVSCSFMSFLRIFNLMYWFVTKLYVEWFKKEFDLCFYVCLQILFEYKCWFFIMPIHTNILEDIHMTFLLSHLKCPRIWQRSCQSCTICFSDCGLCDVHALKLASFLFIDCIHASQLSNVTSCIMLNLTKSK